MSGGGTELAESIAPGPAGLEVYLLRMWFEKWLDEYRGLRAAVGSLGVGLDPLVLDKT
jgi:hypothetical protein